MFVVGIGLLKVILCDASRRQKGGKGCDIAGHLGQDIKATAPGRVVYAGDALPGYGRLIIIQHSPDLFSAYAYNQSILVRTGEEVGAGEVIAKMGTTRDTGGRVRLHFEMRFAGRAVDPMIYLSSVC